MILSELTEGMAWAKRGGKVVRKFRCTSGRRKSRIVSSPAQCFAAPDIKKRIKLKMTKTLNKIKNLAKNGDMNSNLYYSRYLHLENQI